MNDTFIIKKNPVAFTIRKIAIDRIDTENKAEIEDEIRMGHDAAHGEASQYSAIPSAGVNSSRAVFLEL